MSKIKSETLGLDIVINGDPARKEISELSSFLSKASISAKNLKEELKGIGKNDSNYSSKKAEIDKLNVSIGSTKTMLQTLRGQLSVNSMTMNELSDRVSLLRTVLRDAVPGTHNWNNLNKELVQSKTRLAELTTQANSTNNTVCSLSNSINKFAGLIGTGLLLYKKFSNSVSQNIESFYQFDEALTDAIKTTGLTKDEVSDLSRELSKVDTKTAQNELLGLVRAGGKLGISGQEDLLGFAKAADKINVALGSDLGGDAEEAITSIGKMVDIFNLKGEFGIEKSMLKVGSAINELGMASTANEGYIVDFSKRLAGIAPNANISISKVLGLAATLDKYGQQSETSATAIGQTIMAMFKRTRTFADIAGLSLKDLQVSQVRSLG